MDPLTFDDDYLHLRVGRGVFEVFNHGRSDFRVPLRCQVAVLADRRVV